MQQQQQIVEEEQQHVKLRVGKVCIYSIQIGVQQAAAIQNAQNINLFSLKDMKVFGCRLASS